ncbi:MAG: carbonic anhydrase [Phycisphaerales bacterium]
MLIAFALTAISVFASSAFGAKPGPDEAVALLKDGNQRFVNGESIHPHTDASRLAQAGSENQGDHAFATVITCSDSRVPVERLFDAGVMDIFVIRVAGNVCDTDEIGSIEYGLAHVNTPVLVVLGHKQCGAVTAVTAAVQGHGHQLERNIPPLVDNIAPAVQRAIAANPNAEGGELVEAGIEENVWQSIEDLFRESPATRELVKSGKTKVLGAIYNVGTGEVEWLPEAKTKQVLAKVEKDPARAMNVYADSHDNAAHGDKTPTPVISPALSKTEREALLTKPVNPSKPTPDQAIEQLRAGNQRFVNGESIHPNTDAARLFQAGTENQGDHAFATIITCSDSRVPVERVFDAGVMDTFIIRVAGNVCDTDEIGSIEYGLAHVNTPVLVVLGHKQCGAVTAVTAAVQGHGHQLERNIPPLVDNIAPAVQRAIASHPNAEGSELVEAGIEENVWQSIEDLFRESPATRELVKAGRTKVVGAIYNVGTGEVEWLPEAKTKQVLAKVEKDPARAMNVFADSGNTDDAHPQANTHGNASTHAAEAKKDMAGWTAELGASGTFAAPGLTKAKRAAFGPDAGKAEPIESNQSEEAPYSVVKAFWAATGMATLLTLLIGLYLSKIETGDGTSTRGFTLGAKLSLSMGAMAVLILLVSSMALSTQQQNREDVHHFSDIVADAGLIGLLQRDVLMVRMNVKDFLITNSDEDLSQYSDYIASATGKIRAAESKLTDPKQLKHSEEIMDLLNEYNNHFAAAVGVIDERNGIVNSQMNPTGARLTNLLSAIIQTAHRDGDAEAALDAAETLDRLTLARVNVMKYLRTSDEQDARAAIAQMELGEQDLNKLRAEVENPTRKKWLAEAQEGYQFYARKAENLIELVHHRNEIVKGELDKVGPKIAEAADDLVELIHAEEERIEDSIDHDIASAQLKAIILSLVVVALAAGISVVLIRNITNAAGKVLRVLQSVARGDLTNEPLNDTKTDEMAQLARATDRMSKSLRDLVEELNATAREVAGAATEIAASSEEMAQGMGEQNHQVTQISAAVEEMSASIIEVARKSVEAASNAQESGKVAEEGGRVVSETIEGMNEISGAVSASAASVSELGKRGEQIGEIIKVINDIADQTNLLALNAAIEAARAGEHGRGFAVVADEVRKLADRTTKATEEIGDSIKAIQTETEQAVQRMESGTQQVRVGVEKATLAGQSLEQIVAGAQHVAGMIQSIAAAAEQQSAASEQVSRGVQSVSAVTNQSTEGANQAAMAANQLSSKAEQLQALVGKFKL